MSTVLSLDIAVPARETVGSSIKATFAVWWFRVERVDVVDESACDELAALALGLGDAFDFGVCELTC